MTKEKTTIFQEVVSGIVAGFVEVFANHPLWTIKTRIQGNLPFSLNPRILYRGLLPSAASMMPITAAQMASYHVFKSMMFSSSQKISSLQDVASAYAAGAVPAIFASPVELVITHQNQKPDKHFVATAKAILNHGGVKHLYSGFIMTAMRDGCFTVGYIIAPDIINKMLSAYIKNNNDETKVRLLSKVVAGVGSAVVSQAFDTIKTVQQTVDKGSIGIYAAIKKPYVDHGFSGYFKGGLPRGVRVASAVYIMSTVKENMNTFFKQRNIVTESNTSGSENVPPRGSSI